jgi:O-succinylbenzoic acid--CoA ligase
MRELKRVSANDTFKALTALAEALDGGPALYIGPPEVNGVGVWREDLPDTVADHVLLVLESSGSTGRPKLIELSAAAMIASANASATRLGGQGQWLLTLPINHIAGAQVLMRSLMADTQPVLMNSQLTFTAEGFARTASLMTGDKRYTSLVPTQLSRLFRGVSRDPLLLNIMKRFDAILVGGQKPDWAMVQELRASGVNIVVSYGMTETAGGCVYDGRPLDGVGLRLDDSRITISGPILAEGCGPEFVTGDIGVIQNELLEVVGRADRVIISGGLKVSLDRVEEVVRSLPHVQGVIAVSRPVEEWGESVALLMQAPVTVDPRPLLAQVIGPPAAPSVIKYLTELPLLPNGKPDYQGAAQLLASLEIDPFLNPPTDPENPNNPDLDANGKA